MHAWLASRKFPEADKARVFVTLSNPLGVLVLLLVIAAPAPALIHRHDVVWLGYCLVVLVVAF